MMKNNAYFHVLSLLTWLLLPLLGFAQNSAVGGFVWSDLNSNGLQDTLEPGLPGILVVLENDTVAIDTQVTDASGNYLFAALAPDSLRLHVVNPGGVFQTLQNVGANDTIDSDPNPMGFTGFFNLPDSTTLDFDAGFSATAVVCLTPISATVDSITCDDNGTPVDSTDDRFTFRLRATGGTGGWSVPPDTLVFAYDSTFTFGPFPISGGTLTLVVTDTADALCADTITVVPPPHCSTLDTCLTPISASFSDVLCNDNGTAADSTDDVFTFKLTATGAMGVWRVSGDSINHPYDSTFTFGPFPIAGGALTVVVVDSADALCADTLVVTPPPPCSVPIMACDTKEIACIKYELLGITIDSSGKRTYTIQVTNNCPDKLIYTAFQLPDGVVAKAPADNALYTTPSGREYTVRNPNYSPFYSIRFKPVVDSISNGQSDIFEYTLPPQSEPKYIHVIVRIYPKVFYEAHLNTFSCDVKPVMLVAPSNNFGKTPPSVPSNGNPNPGPNTPPGTPSVQPEILVFPNPSAGQMSVDLWPWKDQLVQVQLYSPQGILLQTVSTTAGSDPLELSLPFKAEPGVYWLKVTPPNGKPQVQRVVIQW